MTRTAPDRTSYVPDLMVRILFICGKARKRSPTAAEIAAAWPEVEADHAGLSADADVELDQDQIDRAEVIAVMVRAQLARLKRRSGPGLRGKRLVCLDIPDVLEFIEPDLVALLCRRMACLSLTLGPMPDA